MRHSSSFRIALALCVSFVLGFCPVPKVISCGITQPNVHPVIYLLHSGIDSEALSIAGLSGPFLTAFASECQNSPAALSEYAVKLSARDDAVGHLAELKKQASDEMSVDEYSALIAAAQSERADAETAYLHARDVLHQQALALAGTHCDADSLQLLETMIINIDRRVPRAYSALVLSDAEWERLEGLFQGKPHLQTDALTDDDRAFVLNVESLQALHDARTLIEHNHSSVQFGIAMSLTQSGY